MATDIELQYLRFEAESMLEFLKTTLSESGVYTDQFYDGSNISIILETLSALFEVFIYQLNFQASESTFTGAQIYENMLKIVSAFGYKARATVAPTIIGDLSAIIYLDDTLTTISDLVSVVSTEYSIKLSDVISVIQTRLNTISETKVITKNLGFTTPDLTSHFTVLDNFSVYPNFTNLGDSNIFYYINTYSTEKEAILEYIRYIWNLPATFYDTNDNTLTSDYDATIEDLAYMLSLTTEEIKEKSLLPDGVTYIDAELRVSSVDADNFITAVNGNWNCIEVTTSTLGEAYETYNLSSLSVDSTNISDGTLFAAVYSADDLNSVEIYEAVSNIRSYTSTDKVFEYSVATDKTINIKFGNGIYGEQISAEKYITLYYIINYGEDGEIAKSSFTNTETLLSTATITNNNSSLSTSDLETVNNAFIYETQLDASTVSTFLSNSVDYDGADNPVSPKMLVYFSALENSSTYSPIETVGEIRAAAPDYNRSTDRIITRSDLYNILKNDYSQYIYDTNVMNNFDYIAKFYTWLYKYDKISKDIALLGYKFADSCNFNDVFCWIKGYTKYNINDFIKKTLERDLLDKKTLTTEIIFLDTINTYFYPYVGDIYDDMDWLLECATKYQFLTKSQNTTDSNYKKWYNIMNLFNTDENGDIIKEPTNNMIEYIIGGNNELKIEIQGYRDVNLNENETTISTNLTNAIESFFEIENRTMGETIKLNEINDSIIDVAGLKSVRTVKQKNVALYSTTIPTISAPEVLDPISDSITSTTFNDANIYDSDYVLSFELDTELFDNLDDISINWILYNKSTGKEIKTFNPYLLYGNEYIKENDDEDLYLFNDSSISIEKRAEKNEILKNLLINFVSNTSSLDDASIFDVPEEMDTLGSNEIPSTADFSITYQIYVKCSRVDEATTLDLDCYSNKLNLSFSSLSDEILPQTFTIVTTLDNTSDLTLILGTSDTSTELWETTDSVSCLSFAKWTTSLIDSLDFETVGSGFVSLYDFCFPALYQSISTNITIKDDEIDTVGIEY